MSSFLRKIGEFFGRVFSFGRRVLSEPFFDHVFSIAALLYPPAGPIIEAVDRLFEQETREGFLEQLDQLLERSGIDERQAEIVRHLVSMFFLTLPTGSAQLSGAQKAALSREIIKTAIATNGGLFRAYGVSEALGRLYGIKVRGMDDKDLIPDHLVNFSIELSVVQRKFNRMLDCLIAYAQSAMQPLIDASPEEIEKVLEDGKTRGLWKYRLEDYSDPQVRKAVAALLTKEEALEENFRLWGRPVESIEQIPDCLANFAVEACYADSKQLAGVSA